MGGTGRYGGGGGRVLGRGRREGRWRRGEPPVIIIRDNHRLRPDPVRTSLSSGPPKVP